jgi:hypothetical protein
MRQSLVFCVFLNLLATSAVPRAQSQSLVDVARAEEARRKHVKAAAKVYTNDDLKGGGDATSSSTPAPAPADARPLDAAAKPAEKKPEQKPEDPTKTEAYWKTRMAAARSTLDRSKVFLEALQSRINVLNADFVNVADPGQHAVIQGDLQRATTELERVKKDIETQTKAIADTQEEARRAGVPAGWLR